MSEINKNKIQKALSERGLDAYIIPMTDAHLGEYLPAFSKVVEWVSGFSGSAGIVVITPKFAGLWTDSRYFIQAENELKGSGFELMKLKVPHTPEYLEWIEQHVTRGGKIGVDGHSMSRAAFASLQKTATQCDLSVDFNVDLISANWTDRPALPKGQIFEHPIKYAGITSKIKIQETVEKLTKLGADYLVLSTLDDIAWLTNLRGTDIPYLPVFRAHLVVSAAETALFVDKEKLSEDLRKKLKKQGVQSFSYAAVTEYLSTISPGKTIALGPRQISQSLPGSLQKGVRVLETTPPTTLLKAQKNKTEMEHIRKTMVVDGVVLTKLYYWIDQEIDSGKLTERDVQEKLIALRKEHGAIDESFGPISAYGPHAAMPHYHSTTESNVPLQRTNLYLLDSGGQYISGTTDTTRVLAFGASTAEEKRDYTLVLKGLIACSSQQFPKGTQGYQIDALARSPIWNAGIDFGHGTGHGVGFCLDVHEGPQGIRPSALRATKDSAFAVGMLTSIEPGIYRQGKHGIRIENLVLCVGSESNEFGDFLEFETVTIAPICTNLVEKSLLSKSELKWLRTYNKWVLRKIGRKVSNDEREWVKKMTKI